MQLLAGGDDSELRAIGLDPIDAEVLVRTLVACEEDPLPVDRPPRRANALRARHELLRRLGRLRRIRDEQLGHAVAIRAENDPFAVRRQMRIEVAEGVEDRIDLLREGLIARRLRRIELRRLGVDGRGASRRERGR